MTTEGATLYEGNSLELEMTSLHGTKIYSEKIVRVKHLKDNVYHYSKLRCDSVRTVEQGDGLYLPIKPYDCIPVEQFLFTAQNSSLNEIATGVLRYKASKGITPNAKDILMS